MADMVEFVTKKNIINFLLRVIPLSTLFFTWVDVYGIKPYDGIVCVYGNNFTCILGLAIIFIELFLKLDWKYKIGLNLIGNLIFWVPLFYATFKETKNINNVTVMCRLSIAIVGLCCISQLKMIYTSKLSTL
ncbi:hypothetical protein [Bulleidia sp. zg-1006]|uniref:hypothetical protein n=1 Tax=Bulleidia sp. zg-1006 TaxID=2806552 RepID=UPI00193A8E68|nr:hypothetical protein [Bulleidia sp. zg-1006]QRG86709.1 hypothetical protein JOS54_07680 [Bulleidia sp. zg-1006]